MLIHLQENGLQLIEQNYLTKIGEIDIIMLDKTIETLVFIEVRYRKNKHFGSATDTVDQHKQSELIRTVHQHLQQHSKY